MATLAPVSKPLLFVLVFTLAGCFCQNTEPSIPELETLEDITFGMEITTIADQDATSFDEAEQPFELDGGELEESSKVAVPTPDQTLDLLDTTEAKLELELELETPNDNEITGEKPVRGVPKPRKLSDISDMKETLDETKASKTDKLQDDVLLKRFGLGPTGSNVDPNGLESPDISKRILLSPTESQWDKFSFNTNDFLDAGLDAWRPVWPFSKTTDVISRTMNAVSGSQIPKSKFVPNPSSRLINDQPVTDYYFDVASVAPQRGNVGPLFDRDIFEKNHPYLKLRKQVSHDPPHDLFPLESSFGEHILLPQPIHSQDVDATPALPQIAFSSRREINTQINSPFNVVTTKTETPSIAASSSASTSAGIALTDLGDVGPEYSVANLDETLTLSSVASAEIDTEAPIADRNLLSTAGGDGNESVEVTNATTDQTTDQYFSTRNDESSSGSWTTTFDANRSTISTTKSPRLPASSSPQNTSTDFVPIRDTTSTSETTQKSENSGTSQNSGVSQNSENLGTTQNSGTSQNSGNSGTSENVGTSQNPGNSDTSENSDTSQNSTTSQTSGLPSATMSSTPENSTRPTSIFPPVRNFSTPNISTTEATTLTDASNESNTSSSQPSQTTQPSRPTETTTRKVVTQKPKSETTTSAPITTDSAFHIQTSIEAMAKEITTESSDTEKEKIIVSVQRGSGEEPQLDLVKMHSDGSNSSQPFVKAALSYGLSDFCEHKHRIHALLREWLDLHMDNQSVANESPYEIEVFYQPNCEDVVRGEESDLGNKTDVYFYVKEDGRISPNTTLTYPRNPTTLQISQELEYLKEKILHLELVSGSSASSVEDLLTEEVVGTSVVVVVVVTVGLLVAVALGALLAFIVVRRKRTNDNMHGRRCTPANDAYSLDSVSVYFQSLRRKSRKRQSNKSLKSYLNQAFEDPNGPSRPLNFAKLTHFIADHEGLYDEFSKIPAVVPKYDEMPRGVEEKNRYANVIPVPETRILLRTAAKDSQTKEYINANTVHGPRNELKYYIATQAPLDNTVADFWQMIWQEESKVIVMLTDFVEKGVDKCADYLPPSETLDCHRVYGDFQITLKSRDMREKYVASMVQIKNLENNLTREICHMWYTGWPHTGVPNEEKSFISFIFDMRAIRKQLRAKGPIVVHCSPGTGRTGTFCAIDLCMRQFDEQKMVDIPKSVYRIRRERAGAVQTKEQYAFIYRVVNLYAAKLTTGNLDSF